MHHILIAEDDSAINDLLAEILRRNGYLATQAYSGTEARLLLQQNPYDMALLDLMLPGMSGEELIAHIRQTSSMPILVLSAKDTPEDKIYALRTGADDYMTKPFNDGELLARVEAGLRRGGSGPKSSAQPVVYKDIYLDREARTVEVCGAKVPLTATEFAILELLLSNPKKVFTKTNLYRSVWNDEFYGDDNTINVHISKIRAKLGKGEYIETVWGIGFKMAD